MTGWRDVLIERTAELDAVETAYRRAGAGLGQTVLVEGPAGIGKSRLLEAVRGALPDLAVLTARGGVLERDAPFGVARQLLAHRLVRTSAADRAALMAGPAAAAGEVLGLTGHDGEPDPVGVGGDFGASLHCLFWLLANMAERAPLVLVVDDAHWSDSASLHLLAYLARRIEGLPVLLVAAARPGERGPQRRVIDEIAASARIIKPAPLTPTGVAALVDLALGARTPELAAACREATGGNPFLLVELLAALAPLDPTASVEAVRAVTPSTIVRSVLLRVGCLPGAAPRLAVAAALLGDGAALRHAASLAAIRPPEANAAADVLVAHGVLATVHPLRFEHPLVRAALAQDVAPAQRAALHGGAALLLHEEAEPNERVVAHLMESAPGCRGWAVDRLRSAARAAATRGATDVAVRLLTRALAEPPPAGHSGPVLAELARAQLTGGDVDASLLTFDRAVDATGSPEERTEIRLALAEALLLARGSQAALHCLEHGVGESGDGQLVMRVDAQLAAQCCLASLPHPVIDGLDRHRRLAGNTNAGRHVIALLAQQSLRRDEPSHVTRDLARRALAGGRLLEEESGWSIAYYAAVGALIDAEAYADAGASLDRGLANAALRSFDAAYVGALWLRGVLRTREGDLAAAEADQRAACAKAVGPLAGHARASLALVLLEQGDVTAARRELEGAGLFAEAPRPMYVWGPYVRGLVLLAERNPAEALADFQEVGRHATRVGGFAGGLPWQGVTALALHALGDRSGAEQAAGAQLERAERRGAGAFLGVALRVCGLVATGGERLAHLSHAVEVLEASAAKLELARARCDLGVVLLRSGRRSGGRELLERALVGARECGALRVAALAHEELRVAGARPRRLCFEGVDSLTASERRVAVMAAEGLTNREIAETLFVTPKTVENHLSRVYTKLDVSSRRALRGVLVSSSRREPARI